MSVRQMLVSNVRTNELEVLSRTQAGSVKAKKDFPPQQQSERAPSPVLTTKEYLTIPQFRLREEHSKILISLMSISLQKFMTNFTNTSRTSHPLWKTQLIARQKKIIQRSNTQTKLALLTTLSSTSLASCQSTSK